LKRDDLALSPKLYVSEIVDSIEKIENYTQSMSCDNFVKYSSTMDAVDANIMNIDETVRVLVSIETSKSCFIVFACRILILLKCELTLHTNTLTETWSLFGKQHEL
jgi:hypothetical protein